MNHAQQVQWYSLKMGGAYAAPEQDKLDPDRAPDLVGEVLGWRTWNCNAQGDLFSANGHAVWRPGPNRAVCGGIGGTYDHPAPQEKCSCGWYALHERAQDDPRGIIRAWGKLIVHPTGFRAEWAEIVCLVSDEPAKNLKRAAGYYDIPILPEKEALAYAREGGHDFVPKELRPEPPNSEVSEDPFAWPTAQAVRNYTGEPKPAPPLETRDVSVPPLLIAGVAGAVASCGFLAGATGLL